MAEVDSPSKQLMWELQSLLIAQEDMHMQRERKAAERAAAHRIALAAAAAEHEKVRNDAEAVRLKLEEAIRVEKERRREVAKRQAEQEEKLRIEQEAAARQRQEDEERARVENQRKLVEKLRKEREQEQEKKREAAEQESRVAEERRVQQDQIRQARERQQKEQVDAAARRSAQIATITPPQPGSGRVQPTIQNQTKHQSSLSSQQIAADAALHTRYLEIHQSLKQLRRNVTSSLLANKPLKAQLGDLRRSIKKSLGQLTAGGKNSSATNRAPLQAISTALKSSLDIPSQRTVPLSTFFASALPPETTAQPPQIPTYFLYLLSIFSKSLITQLLDEASAATKLADPLGIIASHVFASQTFLIAGRYSLIDVLLAKYHLICPVLFIVPPQPPFSTIRSLESSTEGRALIGWRKDDPPQRHYERQTGLGAGFAALALRNYEKAKALSSPLPQLEWWKSVARICSLPGEILTDTHCIVLKSMIEGQEQRILEFFGSAGKMAMKEAVVGIRQKVRAADGGKREGSTAAKGLAGLKDVLEKDRKLFL